MMCKTRVTFSLQFVFLMFFAIAIMFAGALAYIDRMPISIKRFSWSELDNMLKMGHPVLLHVAYDGTPSDMVLRGLLYDARVKRKIRARSVVVFENSGGNPMGDQRLKYLVLPNSLPAFVYFRDSGAKAVVVASFGTNANEFLDNLERVN